MAKPCGPGAFSVRAVVQRVDDASVEVDGQITGQIGRGLMVLAGCGEDDGSEDAR